MLMLADKSKSTVPEPLPPAGKDGMGSSSAMIITSIQRLGANRCEDLIARFFGRRIIWPDDV
jgi:hypothetical protein